ncbi:MBOAT family protein [Achromobacter sp. GG226]|uniref:MBOAT family O-acyltransferase n=1 Tax=Verticiella alkaliphila TaxID=2779529 RepID=UPI001C0BBE58|nr:MBOAT family protein [Verticiella sp. GG226]MBU4609752.1 MBOAT family protein [Verticiella sp. GG226]
MVFASLEFLTLFLPAFLLAYLLTPSGGRNAVLMLGSWLFYGWWSPWYLWLLVANTVVVWAGALAIERTLHERARSALLTLLIVVNLAALGWYKYANIVVTTASDAAQALGHAGWGWERIALPIGLSFFVLQSISYLVDVRRGLVRAQSSFIVFAAYHAMFGQLIAGPIIRYVWVASELAHRALAWDSFSLGARRFMIGLAMKVLVADTLAPIADTAFALPAPSFADAWLGCLAYSLQLFFDFAGYSAMAIGLGMMLGFHFPENFLNPYLATSIQDFWRRWHISLSSWLRDYLYIPLGGNRGARWRTYRNLFLTMAIAGLWHGGDSWNFLIWGCAHGLGLCAARLWTAGGGPVLPTWLARALTLLFVALAWTLFRATSFDGAWTMLSAQFGLHGFALGESLASVLRPVHGLAAALGVYAIVHPVLQPRWLALGGTSRAAAAWRAIWPVAAFMLAFALISSRDAVPFLYFQF